MTEEKATMTSITLPATGSGPITVEPATGSSRVITTGGVVVGDMVNRGSLESISVLLLSYPRHSVVHHA